MEADQNQTPQDAEIRAMISLATALEPLEKDARGRVLDWAIKRFAGQQHSGRESPLKNFDSAMVRRREFETFAELFDATSPNTDRESALVAGYWVQVCGSAPNFQSQSINSALKDLGRGVGNITDALESWRDEKPALVLQLRKGGTSKQARKTYKLTQEGVKRVEQMFCKEMT